MVDWPDDLPCQPTVDSLTISQEPNVVEFQTEVGRPLRRRRYTGIRTPMSGVLKMTAEQAQAVMDFFHDDCADGTLSFNMKDWFTRQIAVFSWMAPPQLSRMTPNKFMVALSLAREP